MRMVGREYRQVNEDRAVGGESTDCYGWHSFRHTVGATIWEPSNDIMAVHDYLRHSDPSMAKKYIDGVDSKLVDAQGKMVARLALTPDPEPPHKPSSKVLEMPRRKKLPLSGATRQLHSPQEKPRLKPGLFWWQALAGTVANRSTELVLSEVHVQNAARPNSKNSSFPLYLTQSDPAIPRKLVDLVGIEPTTSSMPWKRAPSCATGPLQRKERRPVNSV